MKPTQLVLRLLCLSALLSQPAHAISFLVNFRGGDPVTALAPTVDDFKIADAAVETGTTVNNINAAFMRTDNLVGTRLSGVSVIPTGVGGLYGSFNTIKGLYNTTQGDNAVPDQKRILDGYFFRGGVDVISTITVDGLAAIPAGQQVKLTLYGVGDSLDAANDRAGTIFVVTHNNVASPELTTSYGDPGTPAVTYTFIKDAADDKIAISYRALANSSGTGAETTGFNGFSITSPNPITGGPVSVTLTPDPIVFGIVGETALKRTAIATATYAGGAPPDLNVSPDLGSIFNVTAGSAFLTIDNDGLITPAAPGTATIRVVYTEAAVGGNRVVNDTVGVTIEEVDTVLLSAGNTDLKVDGTVGAPGQLLTEVTYPTAGTLNVTTNPAVIYTSDKPEILEVTETGKLMPKGPGVAMVTARVRNKTSAPLTVNISAVTPKPLTAKYIYKFNEPDNETVADGSVIKNSVTGGMDATLRGTDAKYLNGRLVLPGGMNEPSNTTVSYVELPTKVLTNLETVDGPAPTAVTVETFISWKGNQQNSRVFDFGSFNTLGTSGQEYFVLTPNGSDAAGVEIGYALNANIGQQNTGITELLPANPENPTHLVITYDSDDGLAKIYLNGERKLTQVIRTQDVLSAIDDASNFLGRSHWMQDPRMAGSYDEFKIYTGIMTDAEALAKFTAGPDTGTAPPTVSSFVITSALYNRVNNEFTLTWNSTPGSKYTIQGASDDLVFDETIRMNIDAAAVGTTTTAVVEDVLRPTFPKRFFRIRRE